MIHQRKIQSDAKYLLDVLWYIDKANLSDTQKHDILAPSGHIHLVYNFADACYLLHGQNKLLLPEITLGGQFKKALHLLYGKHLKQVGFAFKPLAFSLFFRQNTSLYTEVILDVSTILNMQNWHKSVKTLVKDYQTPNALFDAIENYIMSFFKQSPYSKTEVERLEYILNYMETNKGMIHMDSLSKKLGFSISTIERSFKKYMGLTPKAYADILRFRYAMLEKNPQILFYDQAHFIKTCKKYTSQCPSHLLNTDAISLLYTLNLKE